MRLTEKGSDDIQWEQRPYQAQLIDIEERESTHRPGETYARLVFEITEDGENKGLRLGKNAGWTLHPKGNLRGLAEGLLGGKIKQGETIETDALIGKECNIMVIPPDEEGGYADINGAYPLRKDQKEGEQATSTKKAAKGKTQKAEAAVEEEAFDEIPF